MLLLQPLGYDPIAVSKTSFPAPDPLNLLFMFLNLDPAREQVLLIYIQDVRP